MHTIAITEQGARLHLEGEQLALMQGSQVVRRLRLQDIDQVLLCGRVEISSAALAALARRRVDVVFLTVQGYFRARVIGPASRNARLRLALFRRAQEPEFCSRVSRAIVAAKIAHQRQVLLRAQRQLRDPRLAEILGRLRLLGEQAARADDLDRLRGLEGLGAALYFSQFGKLLKVAEWRFTVRSRRPPADPVNACLSFGYALLGTVLETEVYRAGLDPLIGFFHQPDYGRPSLMLDLLEEFRPLVDTLVLRLINRRQLAPGDFERRGGAELEEILAEMPVPDDDAPVGVPVLAGHDDVPFDAASAGPAPRPETAAVGPMSASPVEGVYLAAAGRKIFLHEFFRRLRERLYYPPRGGTFELRDILREQVYHLARVVEDQEPGYRPFVPT